MSRDPQPALFMADAHDRINVTMVGEAVRYIERVMGDAERAHAAEDLPRELVLRAIAEGRADMPEACAGCALATCALDFPRWCA